MFFVERLNNTNWVVISGPHGCEDIAFIHARNYANGNTGAYGQVRIVTEGGAVVNLL